VFSKLIFMLLKEGLSLVILLVIVQHVTGLKVTDMLHQSQQSFHMLSELGNGGNISSVLDQISNININGK
jgi:hypothetical protein